MRLDLSLVARTLCETRAEAQRAVKEGRVSVNGCVVMKCACDVQDCDAVTVTGVGCPYVSRGGEKLRGALDVFRVNVYGVTALDIGASTGGFTDCLLQHGAEKVYALENGAGQLHPRLAADIRVVNIEHTNARYITKALFADAIQLVTIDVSFISQRLILPAVAEILEPSGCLITLIKPQFEVGRSCIGKGGIVKDATARENAVKEVCAFARTFGFVQKGLIESPIKGGDGNIEYLAYFVRQEGDEL